MLFCSKCGKERPVGRKMCPECFVLYKREYAKNRHDQFGRYNYSLNCKACNSIYFASRKTSILCPECREQSQGTAHTNQYEYDSDSWKESGHIWKHRSIAETILKRKLSTNEVIHHMDNNPKNNEAKNLLLISRIMHGKLHAYLSTQRVILEKSGNENIENCWNNLIVPMTTAWLETTSAKVIKIWEIGQSAAELASDVKSQQEGSETMHDTPNHLVEGEDIVQTTTKRVSES